MHMKMYLRTIFAEQTALQVDRVLLSHLEGDKTYGNTSELLLISQPGLRVYKH